MGESCPEDAETTQEAEGKFQKNTTQEENLKPKSFRICRCHCLHKQEQEAVQEEHSGIKKELSDGRSK